jgi:hypothetical protein
MAVKIHVVVLYVMTHVQSSRWVVIELQYIMTYKTALWSFSSEEFTCTLLYWHAELQASRTVYIHAYVKKKQYTNFK